MIIFTFVYVLLTQHLTQQSPGLTSIFIYFVQTALLMSSSLPWTTSASWLNFFGMHTENLLGSLCIGPITPLGKVALSLALSFMLLLELALTFAGRVALHRGLCPIAVPKLLTAPVSPTAYFRTLLALLLFSFTSLVTSCVNLLDCVDIGPFRVVAVYPAIDCRTDSYKALYPMVVVILLSAGFLFAALATFLFFHRGELSPGRANGALARWSVLFEDFKPNVFYWVLVVLLRRTAYVTCTTIDSLPTRFMAFGLLSVFFAVLQFSAQPYADKPSNFLETMSLSLHGCLAVLLANYRDLSPDGISMGIAIFVSLPAAVFVLCIAVQAARDIEWCRQLSSRAWPDRDGKRASVSVELKTPLMPAEAEKGETA